MIVGAHKAVLGFPHSHLFWINNLSLWLYHNSDQLLWLNILLYPPLVVQLFQHKLDIRYEEKIAFFAKYLMKPAHDQQSDPAWRSEVEQLIAWPPLSTPQLLWRRPQQCHHWWLKKMDCPTLALPTSLTASLWQKQIFTIFQSGTTHGNICSKTAVLINRHFPPDWI